MATRGKLPDQIPPTRCIVSRRYKRASLCHASLRCFRRERHGHAYKFRSAPGFVRNFCVRDDLFGQIDARHVSRIGAELLHHLRDLNGCAVLEVGVAGVGGR
jgi:hypothetical protein